MHANEIKKRTGAASSDGQAKMYAHWIDSAYLAHKPQYHEPPSLTVYKELLVIQYVKIYQKMEVKENITYDDVETLGA